MFHMRESELSRRCFLHSASLSAFALALHESPAWGAAAHPVQETETRGAASPAPPALSKEHRIRSLRLKTAEPLENMKRFYGEVLGQRILVESATALTIAAGLTRLTFEKVEPEGPYGPWYHVAFNIPENKLFLAREWQLERTPLKKRLPGSSTLEDTTDVANFSHWNAHAVFFWDPAGNLLEYIARHTMKNAAEGPFTPEDILYASEIGLIVEQVAKEADAWERGLSLPSYLAAGPDFRPMGDEYGLLIVFSVGREWGAPDGSPRGTSIYPTSVTIRGDKAQHDRSQRYPYEIIVEA